ncbi:MAG: hypothetical protein DRN71_06010 [Candidatus Nanohalarchaeota archaeon]|nr:MAG: hypothetical protein DRN71_06010 [Candidatus Nanohaloarchaeota archaeon]
MKLNTKIPAIFILFVLILSAATIIIGNATTKNIIEKQVQNNLESCAHSRANHIEQYLDNHKQTAKMMASSILFRNAVNPGMNHTQSTDIANKRIKAITQSNKEISRIRIIDKDGIVIASTHEDIGFDLGAKEIFMKGKQGVYIGDIHISKYTGNIVISIAAPILLNGKSSGVLILNIDADKALFETTTDPTGLGETGEIYLINKDSYMITPSRFKENTFLKQKVNTENAKHCFEHAKEHHQHEEEHIGHEAVTVFKNYMNTPVMGTHVYIKDMNWCLLAEISRQEAYSPITLLTTKISQITLLISLIGIILSILFSRKITRPIVKLHHGTEEIEKGNLDFKVGTPAKDEIGQLSRSFDTMAANLKKTQDELKEHNKTLEKKVQERTKELHNKMKETESQRTAIANMLEDTERAKESLEKAKQDIEKTNQKLEHSNKELQNFVYIASHDLREPMRKISSFGKLLQNSLDGKLDTDQKENFEFMIDGSIRMQTMIQDLLTYSRVTTKAKPFEKVDLNKVIDNLKTIELAIPLEETKGIINIPKPLPKISADPSQIHQLLQNLIGNALKYHKKGTPPVITIRASKKDTNNTEIEIQDNGIGIPKEFHEKIFGMFKRLQSRKDYEGNGIGLAVCEKIVERHNGTIGVKSSTDNGTTFHFTIPHTK